MIHNSSMLLNGQWETGTDRIYNRLVNVPGLATDPKKINAGTLWYKKVITLPQGEWTHATLLLKGARFCPSVYVNERLVSSCAGGMAPTRHLLKDADIKPGNKVLLEIALKSLNDVEYGDASRIPEADRWRSNVSSCLWDDVVIRLHKHYRINRLIPYPDTRSRKLTVRWEIERLSGYLNSNIKMLIQILDKDGAVIREKLTENAHINLSADIDLKDVCKLWSPEEPNCYILKAVLKDNMEVLDEDSMTFGFKEFGVKGLGFTLNHEPIRIRAGSVVWHRWVRDPEAHELAYDEKWFEINIVQRLKSHGANLLRFHLGMPPEKFLDLCDRHGLLVQAEWSFFHGMTGSRESLIEQWRDWLDLCMRHPSTAIIHAWNETEEEELKTAYEVVEILSKEYPPLVFGHRDVIHLHKYWWSLFENVGLLYDSAEEFDKPIMADEFGGNYLDGDCNPGAYPTIKDSFLRFIGRNHDRETRLQHQVNACSRMAEYWRRIGAAGFSPFVILSSPEDGNHHFLGKLVEGRPKPVWDSLTAAYSPVSVSLNIWDRNFTPGQAVTIPVHLFNDTKAQQELHVEVTVKNLENDKDIRKLADFTHTLDKYSTCVKYVEVRLPGEEGEWLLSGVLVNKPETVKHTVASSWRIRTMSIKVPEILKTKKIAVPCEEEELKSFLSNHGLDVYGMDEKQADVVIMSFGSLLRNLADPGIKEDYEKRLKNGCAFVILDAGDEKYGKNRLNDFFNKQNNIGGLIETELFSGVKVVFRKQIEPESCMHPAENDASLWENLNKEATWLWNGLRGGLIVPEWDMEILGHGAEEFISQWANRGADVEKMTKNEYYAYELCGMYAFSVGKDEKVIRELRQRVLFLREDAPALKDSIDPNGPVQVINLSEAYRQSINSQFESIKPLANCGRGLSRVPVTELTVSSGSGKLILSQAITGGRLENGFGTEGLYGIRKDPAAGQFVLNMIKKAIS